MRVIDQNLIRAFNSHTSSSSSTPAMVDDAEARELVSIAEDINAGSAKCCGFVKSHKGEKDLKQLFLDNQTKFDPNAQKVINVWLNTHHLPAEPVAPVAPVTPVGPRQEVKIGSWKCEKQTWHCHWFPMQARQPGGDPTNNLYAEKGVLHKYDQAFGRSSRTHELENLAKAYDAGDKYAWWGHCNFASQVASLLEKPIYDVTHNGVTFTAHDISGLLVKIVPSLSGKIDFSGKRYNEPSDNPNEPVPSQFLKDILQKWGYKADKPKPFILDIDRKEQVWNYPFDQGEVYECNQPPEGFDVSALPTGGKIKYYRAELSGTGFDEQKREYQFWVHYDEHDNMMEGGEYIVGGDAKINPDFGWQALAKGDLSQKEFWVTDERSQNNPLVRAEDVYPLYMASISRSVRAVNTVPAAFEASV